MKRILQLVAMLVIAAGGYGGYLYWKLSGAPEKEDFTGKICIEGENKCLDQGWDENQRGDWYVTSQGSRLFPQSWWMALEVAESETKFASDEHLLGTLAYLANVPGETRVGLPLGFTVDHDPSGDSRLMCETFPKTCEAGTMEEPWVGLNCSACHTNDIKLGDVEVRVEGAPVMADFQALEETLHAATKATLEDSEKWGRFSAAVLGSDAGDADVELLRAQVEEQSNWQARLEEKNATPGYRYGHGRLDAQGHILNKVAILQGQLNDDVAEVFEKPDLFDPPFKVSANAPSSYPFVWNTSQQKSIQWNGIASNTTRLQLPGGDTDAGALIRNVSEVIGVFGHIETDKGSALGGYKSSLRLKNMVDLEQLLQGLHSPRWPEAFPPYDQAAADRGEVLFKDKCASCHAHLESDDTTSPANESMHAIMVFDETGDENSAISDPMTDPLLACNTYYHGSKSGNQAGQKTFVFKDPVIQEEDLTRNMLVNATIGSISGKRRELVESVFEDLFGFKARRAGTGLEGVPLPSRIEYMPGLDDANMKAFIKMCAKESAKLSALKESNILAYKARPLNGIWATAPYLHNGSVPTLYDLLLPSDMRVSTHHDVPLSDAYRPREFGVGTREFDPVNVGFVTDPESNPFVFRTHDDNGQPIPGNYNSGHDYGVSEFSEQDRRDLVEYMKSL